MPRSATDATPPAHCVRECMSLDCGGAAIVVELDRIPERAWMKSLKRALQEDDVLEGAQAKFDGRCCTSWAWKVARTVRSIG